MKKLLIKISVIIMFIITSAQTNDDIKKLESDIKKAATDIAETLKIEVAIKGKKLKNFFINNDLTLISENGSREYKFKEKTYEIINGDTIIQSGSWKVHGLLKNQIRLISDNDKKKYYLKKISKKPWIYNYNKPPGSEGATKEILHIKSSSKFSDIYSDVKFTKAKVIDINDNIKTSKTNEKKSEEEKPANEQNKKKKIEEEKLANEQNEKKNKADLLLRVNCWSKKDGYPDPERAKLYGRELYFIIDTKQNTVERFYQEGQDEIKQTLFNIVEIDEKKVIYQAKIFNPSKNRKVEFEYEFYYGGTTDHNGFGYPIYRLKPDVRKPYINCSKEYHSIEVLTKIENDQSYKDVFIEKRIKVEKNFEKKLLGNCFSGGFAKGHQVLKNYLGYAFELISIYNFETDMSKNNINYCHTVQFKPKIYTKNLFDVKTSDARIKWGNGQSIQIDNFTYEDGKIVPVSVIDVDQFYNCLWMIFVDTKINEDNFISLYMELNDGRHILTTDDQSDLFLKKYCI